jgi:hypothetical protein
MKSTLKIMKLKTIRSSLIIAAALLFSGAAARAQLRVAPGQLIKTVSATATPEAISATDLWVTKAIVIGKKAARTANTGNVHVGPTSANDTQGRTIATGAELTFEGRAGEVFNLASLYVDVETNGDGVLVIYYQY